MKILKHKRLRSSLQEKILTHICRNQDVDYHSISKATDKDRITIMQSLQPLIEHKYVKKIKLEPNYKRSKLNFIPTDKGIFYTSYFLGEDLEDLRRIRLSPDQLRNHNKFLKVIPDIEGRRRNERVIVGDLLLLDLFDQEGSVIDKDQLSKRLFRFAFLRYLTDKKFSLNDLFLPVDVKHFKEICHPSEVVELQLFFEKLIDNLTRAVEMLKGQTISRS